MRPPAAARPSRLAEVGRFLEIQNLGLNLPFAVAFLLAAARGVPSWWVTGLIVVAFVAARNAGHSFNRWADRGYDAANPRTRGRALPSGRLSPTFALTVAVLSGGLLIVAAGLLNLLALALAPVALALIFVYSYTKRFTALTTPYLGLVEGITPAAIYIAVTGTLPWFVLTAVGALVAWGTAFETVHSLGDVDADRAAGLRSLPARWGPERARRALPLFHATAVGLFVAFVFLARLAPLGLVGVVPMIVVAGYVDLTLAQRPRNVLRPFRLHFVAAASFLAGVAASLFAGSL
ncbi:MAG TPA: UbiA family prenyltransferase [Thermoplasmata archaeon]|nr:UbiA family prenyltransferase [Thermoplasmata archaeon]